MKSLMRGIKEAVAAKLAAIPQLDAKTIHVRDRNWSGEADDYFAALFTAAQKINGWTIEHRSGQSENAETDRRWRRQDEIILRGFYGFSDKDDSEATFSLIVEKVIEALNADVSVGGTVTTHGTVQTRLYQQAKFGGNLCHYAELALVVTWFHKV